MTSAAARLTETALARPDAFFQDSLRTLPVCLAQCTCPDHWHPLWAALKATGLARGMYSQAAFLEGFLAPYRRPERHVMIAGAADTGALDVLNAVLDGQAPRYTLVDRCDAPLRMVADRARELGVPLQTVRAGLDEARSDGDPWDLVFIHYTLGFMDSASRLRMMGHLRQDLREGGLVVCAVRHKQPEAGERAAREAAWVAQTTQLLRSTYADHPEFQARLTEFLPPYAHSRSEREDTMPHFDVVRQEFEASGFRLLDAQRNPGQGYVPAHDLNAPGSLTTWIGLFAPAA